MSNSSERPIGLRWLRYLPSMRLLAEYRSDWLHGDVVAGVTLAAYAIPVSLAYTGPQVCPASWCVLCTVGAIAEGDPHRYAQIASLAGSTVAAL